MDEQKDEHEEERQEHRSDPMPFATLPFEIHLKVLKYLSPKDLCAYERVCKDWRSHFPVMNEVWWLLCMAEWWAKADRPKYMSKADKKKKWKECFARITPHAAHDNTFVKSPSRPLIMVVKDQPELPPEREEFDKTAYKVEMRAFYKSIRSKPKGKGGNRGAGHRSGCFVDD